MHIYTSKEGIEFIKKFEGCSLNIYKCSAGYATIGYGHKIKSQENFDVINYTQAEEILAEDLYFVERAIIRNIFISLKQNQFDALVSFAFNLGTAALQRSSLRHKINHQICINSEDIYFEFTRWIYAGGIKLTGLLNRRRSEAYLFNNGDYGLN